MKSSEDYADLVMIANKVITISEYEENQKQAGKKFLLRSDIGRLMREVVRCATFVMVIPAMLACSRGVVR
ncbi:hypothetical protein NW762_014493 [Fusarium torreyae]|uniref:Uncharacterized protein n=1 Tax=Fusarium torreyae TaxID=1237075 RepID=A0A9W8RIM8_9HYPO|nr:hypothetical protein NW762_014493 [Fusarium torreyae]